MQIGKPYDRGTAGRMGAQAAMGGRVTHESKKVPGGSDFLVVT